jgi:uncharacterized protein (TIGR02996 family)
MWPDCASHPTGLALLHGARDNPEEDDRRLILADWLDDQGEDLVAHLLRLSLPLDEWIIFPGVVRDRWRPWNGCWRGWPGIKPWSSFALDSFPDSPWLCVVNLRSCNSQGIRHAVLSELQKRLVCILAE